MKKISIVIPVYNAEKFVGFTLDNILAQSIDDYEVILVNDGSKDLSLEIMKKYEAEFEQVRVISYNNNMGQAYARNIGLKEAKGKYIYFIDADDFLITNDCLELIYCDAEKYATDILIFNSVHEYENEALRDVYGMRSGYYFDSLNSGFVGNGQDVLAHLLCENEFNRAAWTYLFSRDFLLSYNLTFVQNTSPHEDVLFTFSSFMCANRVGYCDKDVYKYIIRKGSCIHRDDNFHKRYVAYCNVYIESLKVIEDYLKPSSTSLSLYIQNYLLLTISCLRTLMRFAYDAGMDLNDCGYGWQKTILISSLLGKYPFVNRFFTPQEYNRISATDRIYIYGAGKVGKSVELFLSDIGISNPFFVVSQPNDENIMIVDDIAIYEGNYEIILAVAGDTNKREMIKKLEELQLKKPIVIT